MQITDKATLGSFRVTDEGYLEGNALTARTGVQQYLGSEMGRPDLAVVNVYRDGVEVFNKASLNTFSKIPITVGHPAKAVTADNWSDLAVGTTGDEVLRDGEFLKIGIKITDATAVKAVEDGKRELSVGYGAEIDWGDGVAPDGTPYQARQTGIVANHIAIVDRARAGSKARIGDGAVTWGASPLTADRKEFDMPSENKTTVVLGDAAVTVAPDQAPIIDKFKTDQAKLLADAQAEHAKEMATKDAELAARDAEIKKLKDKELDDAALDKRVAARSALCDQARSIAKDLKTEGLSDADIRKAAVKVALGDDAIKDKADAYIDARFDILAEDAAKGKKPDKIADALAKGVSVSDDTADAYAIMLKDMRSAHDDTPAKEA